MSELHKFVFDGLPVRGMLVRLTDGWQELLSRRAANTETGPYPVPVQRLLGEMSAAAVLLQSNIKFNGSVILQVQSHGRVQLAVVDVQPDLAFRATAKVVGPVGADDGFVELVSAGSAAGRCAITLDPLGRQPGQHPYQGVVSLVDAEGEPLPALADVLSQYMQQSEQLDTTLVLAADGQVAAGLLIQRLPVEGEKNLAGQALPDPEHDPDEHYRRIAMLTRSLTRDELLSLDAETILRRLYWEEQVLRFEPQVGVQGGDAGPRFACTCNRERVVNMLRSLGQDEIRSVVEERGHVEVGCDFCGQQYVFDPIDAEALFADSAFTPPTSDDVH
ncbi:Hsp33 chaperonin [Comamonas serinivorans]|uniref:Hsp33 chaperonin n=1 Tax=Comamonas serinivorans TaxID=1082851 RepID=A0A1Y0ENR9_9BURK|nr:Hsp33 family molecular chaperone HslO [Comamonas serinivorans]ARU05284.1 Hsp33 chaperonin [Comamonas serinivorans]